MRQTNWEEHLYSLHSAAKVAITGVKHLHNYSTPSDQQQAIQDIHWAAICMLAQSILRFQTDPTVDAHQALRLATNLFRGTSIGTIAEELQDHTRHESQYSEALAKVTNAMTTCRINIILASRYYLGEHDANHVRLHLGLPIPLPITINHDY